MNEQTVFLILLILALAATLLLYIMKAVKQVKYRGDERWQTIQLRANNLANLTNWILIVLLVVVPVFVDSRTTFTLQRVITFGLIYIGVRNLIELTATIYFDRCL